MAATRLALESPRASNRVPLTSPDSDNQAVFVALRDSRERLQGTLPQNRDDLFAWCLEAEQTTLLNVLDFPGNSRGLFLID